jgi:hypothetical protein
VRGKIYGGLWWLVCANSVLAQSLSTPIFSPPSGTPTPVFVTMTNANPDAITYYTLDGTLPGTNSTRYTGPLALTDYTVIRARAYLTGQTNSAAVSAYYYPMSLPPANSYIRSISNDLPATPLVTVVITNAPSISSFALEELVPAPLQPINITGGGVWNPETGAVRWGPYSNTPVFTVSYRVAGLPGAYPLNGSESVDGQWTFNPGPALVTITAPPLALSAIPSAPSQVAMPVFTPPSGASVPAIVSLSCAITNAVITYTLDGSMPAAQSAIYTNPLAMAGNTTIIARAFLSGWTPSAAAVAYFGARTPPPDLQLTRTVNTNDPFSPVVTLLASPGASARCCIVQEFLPPDLNVFNVSAGGVFVPGDGVVKWGPFLASNTPITLSYQAAGLPGVYPVHASWSVDGVSTNDAGTNIVLVLPTESAAVPTEPTQELAPVLSPPGGGSLPVSVTISCSDTNAQIYYTLDGSTPTAGSQLYTTALAITQTTTVRARAYGANSTPSAQVVGYYGQANAQPDLGVSPTIAMNSSATPMVSVAATPGMDLSNACYTVEQWLPAGLTALNVSAGGVFSAGDSIVKWGPFLGAAPQNLSYQAAGLPGAYPVRTTWSINGVSYSQSQSPAVVIAAASNTLASLPTQPSQEPAPLLSPGSAKGLPVQVAISCGDPQAQVYYTLDGSSPTTSSLLYTNLVTIASPATLRARSFKAGALPSAGAVGYYSAAGANALLLVRTVTNNATFLPAISITATPSNVQCYAVTETLATGLMPESIGQNAIWDSANRVIRWGPFLDGHPRVLTYNVTGPSTTYPLSGQGSFDGSPDPITGAASVAVDQTTVIYSGNTNDGFGGAIGNGSLTLSDDGTNVYGTLVTSGPMDNALVIYIASVSGGFDSTGYFYDAGDALRSAISGYTATGNNGGSGQSVLTFAPGFAPGFAIALQPGNGVNFGGLYKLANGGNDSLQLLTSVHLTPVGTDIAGTYRFSFNVTNIGLTPGIGQTFALFGTFITDTAFRSTEAVAGNLTGIQGWNPFTQTAYSTYKMVPALFPLIVVPPASLALNVGQTAQFAVTAIGAPPLSFQWQHNGVNLPGVASPMLTIAGIATADFGSYEVVVTNGYGSVTSPVALLVEASPFSFSTTPGTLLYSNGQFYLQLGGLSGQGPVILQFSTNLTQWIPIFTNPPGVGTIQFIDSSAGSGSFRYYRAFTPAP